MTVPHLLYADVPVFNPRVKISLFRKNEHAGTFGAASLTPDKLAIGVLHRVCEHAGVSSVQQDVLGEYHAIVEAENLFLRMTYSPEDLEYIIT